MSVPQLPAHIRQLVDKKNFVIAIKTLAEEQHISLDEAKAKIDAYEAASLTNQPSMNNQNNPAKTGLGVLQQGLDNHLKQENIKVPLIPRWMWRVSIIILVMIAIALLIMQLFK